MKKCNNCGAQMQDNAAECTKCGAPFALNRSSRRSNVENPETRLVEQRQPETTTTVVYQPIYIQQEPQAAPDGKSKAVISLVLGLFGLVISIIGIPYSYGILSVLALIPCLLGIVFAIRARNRIPVGVSGRSIAAAGLATSVIGTIVSGLITLGYACFFYGLWAICSATPAEHVDYFAVLLPFIH